MNYQEIQNDLRNLADPAIAEHSQRFFKTGKGEYGEGDQFLGIRVPVLRKLARKHKNLPLEEVPLLLKSPFHEERLLALLLLVQKFNKGGSQERASIYQLYVDHLPFINNWDLVDSSTHYIIGPFLEGKERQPLYKWVKSNNLWERRIAIMATFHFIKQNDFEDTLRLAGELLNDKEDLIHKAVGWMLREIGNRNKVVEEKFLKKHYQKMPRTMLRYAIEKFPEAERQLYLNGLIQ